MSQYGTSGQIKSVPLYLGRPYMPKDFFNFAEHYGLGYAVKRDAQETLKDAVFSVKFTGLLGIALIIKAAELGGKVADVFNSKDKGIDGKFI
jgi:hypothetical protein